MLKKYITALVLALGTIIFGQVGLSTSTPDPNSDLDLGANNKALYLNRVANTSAIVNPQPGMVIYDMSGYCVKTYKGNPPAWSGCLGSTPTPAPTNPSGTGSLSGKMCFDVVELFVSNDCGQLAPRLPQKADFSKTATNTQEYTFQPTGTVSNVRFAYFNSNGQVIQSITPKADYSGTLTSAQSAKATVVYYNNLNAAAKGLSKAQALLGDIYVIYNDGTGDKQLKLTARVQDCSCCGAYVSATLWKEFMCQNLGADPSLDPFTPVSGIAGAIYKWGYSLPVLTQTQEQTTPGTIPNATWVAAPYNAAVGDWDMSTQNPCPSGYRVPTETEWNGVVANNTISRVGTFNDSYPNGIASAVYFGPSTTSRTLSLPITYARDAGGGNLTPTIANVGWYWTASSPSAASTSARVFVVRTSDTYINPYGRTSGFSVRCIAQ